MGLTGTLDAMSLGDLLQWISTSRKSGVLTVTRGKTRLQLAVGGSRVLGAYSNEPPLLLGQFLLARGKLDEVTLHDALARQETTGEHLGKVLSELGAVSEEELERYVVLKAEETIFSMLDWTEAVFKFDTNVDLDPRMVRMDHGIDELMLRGAQRQDEMAKIRTVLGDGVVLCRTETELPETAHNSQMAARIYDAVDGRRTLKDILLHTRAPDYFAMKLLYELHRAGVLGIKNVQESEPEPGSFQAIQKAAMKMLNEGQFAGAVSLLTASIKVFPDNGELKQALAEAEGRFLEHVYASQLSPSSVPHLIVPLEIVQLREDLGPNERFIVDLALAGTWSVKAMTRIAPLHEVDVVRATLALMDKDIVELADGKAEEETTPMDQLDEALRRLSGESEDATPAKQALGGSIEQDPPPDSESAFEIEFAPLETEIEVPESGRQRSRKPK